MARFKPRPIPALPSIRSILDANAVIPLGDTSCAKVIPKCRLEIQNALHSSRARCLNWRIMVFELMKPMRHRNIKTTLKYYLHLDAQAVTGNIRRRRVERRGESGAGCGATATGAFLPVSLPCRLGFSYVH